MAAKLAIIKTGSTYPAIASEHRDFDHWLARGLGVDEGQYEVVDVVGGQMLPDPRDTRGVILTGSPAMVTDRADWSERTAEWLARAVAGDTLVLGVCYGHQLLAHALGGDVDDNPHGRQVGTVDVTLTADALSDPLFSVLRPVSHLPVSHVQSVVRLPAAARLLATTVRDPHHAFVYGTHAWGVQFHPEFNAAIARAYIRERRDAIRQEGLDPDELSDAATDTDDGSRLLRRFDALTRQ